MVDETRSQNVDVLQELMKNINETWLKGRAAELKAFFHPHIRFVSPDLKTLGEGYQACINSYADFTNNARVLSFSESDFDIQTWGSSAVVSYRFEIEYDLEGEIHRDSGRDMFFFTNQDSRWLAVWRILLEV
jgi:hypothetical protein